MSFYFTPQGGVRVGRLGVVTGVMASVFASTFLFGIAPIEDEGFYRADSDRPKTRDWILYLKLAV